MLKEIKLPMITVQFQACVTPKLVLFSLYWAQKGAEKGCGAHYHETQKQKTRKLQNLQKVFQFKQFFIHSIF